MQDPRSLQNIVATATTTIIDCYFATIRLQEPGVDFFRTSNCFVIVAFTCYLDVYFLFLCFRIWFLALLGKGCLGGRISSRTDLFNHRCNNTTRLFLVNSNY